MKCKKMANELPSYHSASGARAYVKSFEHITEQEKKALLGQIKHNDIKAAYKGVYTILKKRVGELCLTSKT